MDQREKTQLHSLGIWSNRLLNSFRKRIGEISLKLTIFGCLFSHGLALFRGLFDIIAQHLASQAMKPVTLGPPTSQDMKPETLSPLAQYHPSQGYQASVESEQTSTVSGVSTSLPSLSSNCCDSTKDGKELQPIQDDGITEVEDPESATQVKGPPKKMVSINDRAEVVRYKRKETKKKKATDGKSASLEREKDEEMKPLKSILKVGSS